MSGITLLDIAKRNAGDSEVGLIDETAKAVPEVSGIHPITKQALPNVAMARPVAGINYKTVVRTTLPTVGFRDGNEGTVSTKSVRENRLVECFIMNPRWDVDVLLAESDEDGWEALLADEADAHMQAAWQQLGKQFYYGTNSTYGGHAKGFQGLLQAYDASNMTVDATGTSENGCSSVYAVKFGPQSVRWVAGLGGQYEISDPRIGDINDANGNPYSAHIQELKARPGLQVGSQLHVARIKNVTAQTGKTLTSDMLGDLLTKFRVGMRPDAIFMTQRCLEQYRKDLQAVTSSPSRIPTPIEFEGIPLVPTESLSDVEAVNLAAA